MHYLETGPSKILTEYFWKLRSISALVGNILGLGCQCPLCVLFVSYTVNSASVIVIFHQFHFKIRLAWQSLSAQTKIKLMFFGQW